jgi:proton-translocating NADH-quinone oxidoreductase chain L
LDIYVIECGLLFDGLTCSMLIIVTGISMFVHIYSIGYMSHDPHLPRFMSYLSLFTFFMLLLVTSDNYVQMFIGWEGVGLCSFLLINFWYTRLLANKAALKAMIMNRIADVFFIFGIILIFLTFKTTDFLIVSNLVYLIKDSTYMIFGCTVYKVSLISFFLFIGGVGKSAQLGLHTWLPDAMEGPTPVSSLLHAATMVTAGVFLLIRSSFFFEFSNSILILVALIGGFTAFFSAIIGVFQFDVKKIIAYSTCSQLGYMFFSCGLSNYQIAIFHLVNHAFFKALLFLSAGAIIHAVFDEQDMRRLGGLVKLLPFTYFAVFVGSLAIMGFPFLTGFYSKDLILELAYSRYMV